MLFYIFRLMVEGLLNVKNANHIKIDPFAITLGTNEFNPVNATIPAST